MQTINTNQLRDKLSRNQDFVFLNVLPEEHYEKAHIPGSDNIPYEEGARFLEQVKQKAPDKDTEIVVYCANAECPKSGKAAEELGQAGYTNVKDYEVGTQGWKDADYELAA